MKSLMTPGRIFFAIAMACFGIHFLTYASGAAAAPPGPPWIPGRPLWAYLWGAGLVLAGLSQSSGFHFPGSSPDRTIALGQYFFAISLIVFGTQHFLYARFIATLIPAWIPAHLFWAYFVGVAFFATALAIILRTGAVLATSLLGLMFFLWVVLLHLPRVAASPHNGNEWTSAFVALAMSGSALARPVPSQRN